MIALALCLLALIAGDRAGAASVAGAAPGLTPRMALSPAEPAVPPQGLYEGCAPRTGLGACVERLRAIGAAGFELVLNYSAWYGSPAEVAAYADAATALGLKLIWPLNHPAWRGTAGLASTYPSFAGGSEPGNEAFIAAAVSLVANHPATWGFYVGDELPATEAAAVAQLSATVRTLAPGKPQLYVARPGAARLAPFAPLVNVAGATAYPLGSGDPPVARAARSALAAADAAGAQPAMVLQAFSWSQYRGAPTPPRYPGTRRLRAMRDATIRHGNPAMILWYSYQDILRSDRPSRRWRTLVRAAFAHM